MLDKLEIITDRYQIYRRTEGGDFELIGTVDDLLNSIKLESKLRPVTDSYGQSVKGHSFYWSN